MKLIELKRVGLTDGEIKIYDALLELGETTRTKLAKKSGISPSKIYDVANRLLEKGIISSVKKQGVIHFSAADPERIKDFIASCNIFSIPSIYASKRFVLFARGIDTPVEELLVTS